MLKWYYYTLFFWERRTKSMNGYRDVMFARPHDQVSGSEQTNLLDFKL